MISRIPNIESAQNTKLFAIQFMEKRNHLCYLYTKYQIERTHRKEYLNA
jgi:hypothetical protein